jgi:hypothetical protein
MKQRQFSRDPLTLISQKRTRTRLVRKAVRLASSREETWGWRLHFDFRSARKWLQLQCVTVLRGRKGGSLRPQGPSPCVPRLPQWVMCGGWVQRTMLQHYLSKQTLCWRDCRPLDCQNRIGLPLRRRVSLSSGFEGWEVVSPVPPFTAGSNPRSLRPRVRLAWSLQSGRIGRLCARVRPHEGG